MIENKEKMIGQLQGWVKKELQLEALPPLPTLLLMLLPEAPTREDVTSLYLEAQEGIKPSMTKACPVYRMASKFRGNKDLFLALITYRDEPEVRKAISEERERASFDEKGKLVKSGKWPKGAAVVDAMEKAQSRMVKDSKVSPEAVKAAKKLRAKKFEQLAVVNAEMECTTALAKLSEFDAMLQSLLSDSGKLKQELRNPSLPEHPAFSFAGGRGPKQTKPSAVSATISS